MNLQEKKKNIYICIIVIILIILLITKDVALCQEILGIEEKIKLFHQFLTIKDKEFYIWLINEFSNIDINLEFLESKEEIHKYAQEVESKYRQK